MIPALLLLALAADPDALPDAHVGRPAVEPLAIRVDAFTGPASRDAEDALRLALAASGLFDPASASPRWRISAALDGASPPTARLRVAEASGREALAGAFRGAPRPLGHAIADALVSQLRPGPGPFRARLASLRVAGARHEILVSAWDGQGARRAYAEDGPLLLHGWRPDGGALLFTTWRRGKPEVWLLDLAAGRAEPFLSVGEMTTSAAFSPRGDQVAFVAARGGDVDVWVADARGGGARRLTTSPAVDASPSWSADGRRLAFVSERDGRPHAFVMDADGRNPRRLTWDLAEEQAPRFSPRGDLVAFAGRDAGGWALYTSTPDGRERVAISEPSRDASEPTWDPSGLLVTAALPGGLVAATADGARRTPLPGTAGLRQPAWGPAPRP